MKYIPQLCVHITLVILVFFPVVLFAQAPKFVPLVGVPGFENTQGMSTEQYINALFTMAIGLAALIAVIKIIIAGVKYMFSEIVTDKGAAKKDIQNALLGLIIILASVTLLRTINPNLVNMNLLRNAKPYEANLSGNANGGGCSDSGSISSNDLGCD